MTTFVIDFFMAILLYFQTELKAHILHLRATVSQYDWWEYTISFISINLMNALP